MSHVDSIHWRERAEELRTLAEQTAGEISKHMMYRIADDYERFARIIENRPNRFLAIPPVVPAEVQRFAPCKSSFVAPPEAIDLDIPSFLRRGPAAADEVGASPNWAVAPAGGT